MKKTYFLYNLINQSKESWLFSSRSFHKKYTELRREENGGKLYFSQEQIFHHLYFHVTTASICWTQTLKEKHYVGLKWT